jgi:hypothetical protein
VAILAQAGEVVTRPDSLVQATVGGDPVVHVDVVVEDGAVDSERIKAVYRAENARVISDARRRISPMTGRSI